MINDLSYPRCTGPVCVCVTRAHMCGGGGMVAVLVYGKSFIISVYNIENTYIIFAHTYLYIQGSQ
jgi:hypothetical protein